MLDLRNVAAGVEPEQPVVERRCQRQCKGATVAGLIELGHGRQNVAKCLLDGRPVAPLQLLASIMRQQTGKLEIRLSAIDEFLFAIGDGFGSVLGRRQIERLGVSKYAATRRTLRRKARRSIGTKIVRPITAPASSAAGWRQ